VGGASELAEVLPATESRHVWGRVGSACKGERLYRVKARPAEETGRAVKEQAQRKNGAAVINSEARENDRVDVLRQQMGRLPVKSK